MPATISTQLKQKKMINELTELAKIDDVEIETLNSWNNETRTMYRDALNNGKIRAAMIFNQIREVIGDEIISRRESKIFSKHKK